MSRPGGGSGMRHFLLASLLLAMLGGTALAAVPRPELFDVAWNDLSHFAVDLSESARDEALSVEAAPVYHLEWRLDDGPRLTARQEVLVTNGGPGSWTELYFHLLPNLLGGRFDISELRLDGEPVPVSLGSDGRLLRIELPEGLEPGRQVVVALDYSLEIPASSRRNYGILGHSDGALSLAHAYAMLAVHGDDGWDLDAPPAHGDLVHARSGFFRVRVDAPPDLVLAASGALLERRSSDGRQNLFWAAGPVRDFYLAGGTGLETIEVRQGGVLVRGFAGRGEEAGLEDALEEAAKALAYFGEIYGAYPYRELDLVPISTSALGVEFPGVIALRRELLRRGEGDWLASTVVHEVAHQWFYGVVGNDQVSEPWLDESIAQYLTLRYYLAEYGAEGYEAFRGSLGDRWRQLGGRRMPVGLPVDAYDAEQYGAMVYGLGPLIVEWLASRMGRARFDEFLRAYAERHRYGLARTEDFAVLAEESCGCSLETFFERWVLP